MSVEKVKEKEKERDSKVEEITLSNIQLENQIAESKAKLLSVVQSEDKTPL